MSDKTMDLDEFRDLGLLQEINRTFLHPMGLALRLTRYDERDDRLDYLDIVDMRDDPEGMIFEDSPSWEKMMRVDEMVESKRAARVAALGYYQQPTEEEGS